MDYNGGHMRYDGKKQPYRWTWTKAIIFAFIVAMFILFIPVVAAHASVRQSWGVKDVQNYHYSITEYRSGIFTGRDLWRAQQQVHWSWNSYAGVFNGPNMDRSCWVSDTWNDCRLDRKWVHELHSPHRWQMYAKWTIISNGAYLLADHDHPEIWMTIFANNPLHVSYTAHCGC
jgi:hypothetical protein